MKLLRPKLWQYLTLIYAISGTIGTMAVLIVMDTAISYQYFGKIWQADYLQGQIGAEAQTLRLRALSADNLRPVLKKLTEKIDELGIWVNSDYYKLSTSAVPSIGIQVVDLAGDEIYVSGQSSSDGSGKLISIEYPLLDYTNNILGTVKIDARAYFNPLRQLMHSVAWIVNSFGMFVSISAAVGIFCGYVASRGLVRRLGRVTDVSTSWSAGDFSRRIHDPRGDELSEHAAHLNMMAEQLHGLLILREQSAIREERTRMARDLHDTVKQNLFALSLQISALRRLPGLHSAADRSLGECREIVTEAHRQLAQVIEELRVDVSKEVNLSRVISLICLETERKFSKPVESTIQPNISVASTVATQIGLILREAVLNTVRHAPGARVMVSLLRSGQVIQLMIKDNGPGFLPGRQHAGTGLISMKERAKMLPQGELRLESDVESGTRITLSWLGP